MDSVFRNPTKTQEHSSAVVWLKICVQLLGWAYSCSLAIIFLMSGLNNCAFQGLREMA